MLGMKTLQSFGVVLRRCAPNSKRAHWILHHDDALGLNVVMALSASGSCRCHFEISGQMVSRS